MNALLVMHIALGTLLVMVFLVRYVAVLAKRIAPGWGRHFIAGLASALVASGVAVSVVYHAPLTKSCMSSLGIIAAVIVLEYLLQSIAPKLLPTGK